MTGLNRDSEEGKRQLIDEKLLMTFNDPGRMTFWSEEKVRYQDIDANGHINNVNYLTYVEGARIEYRASIVSRFPEARWGSWVIAASAIRYLSAGRYPGQIRVGVVPIRIGRTSFSLGYGLFQEDACVAVAGSRSVHVDRETGKPVQLPEEFRQIFSEALDTP